MLKIYYVIFTILLAAKVYGGDKHEKIECAVCRLGSRFSTKNDTTFPADPRRRLAMFRPKKVFCERRGGFCVLPPTAANRDVVKTTFYRHTAA